MPFKPLTDGHGSVIGYACSRGQSHTCSSCKRARATKQCDFKIGGGRTCDRHLCGRCAVQQRVGTDGYSVDFCPAHDRMFKSQNLHLSEGKRDG